nr:putative leucine-rich repeat receptor-like protein kinase [Quercus suber]
MALTNLKKVFSLFSLVALAILHSSFDVASLSVNEEAEMDALLNWKASLQNETQSPLTSWTLLPNNATNSLSYQNTSSSSSPCSWFGISCTQAGSITTLNLTNSGLKGTLHDFPFSSLPSLAYLDLSMNELFGTIPPEISHLSKLKYLDLAFNNFSGAIPPQIGLLINLEILSLAENQLNSSIPPEIGQLKSLNALSLFANNLRGSIPASLGNLSNLIQLYVNDNALLNSIPASLGDLSNLAYLTLYNNLLSASIPPEIGNLSNLLELDIKSISLEDDDIPQVPIVNSERPPGVKAVKERLKKQKSREGTTSHIEEILNVMMEERRKMSEMKMACSEKARLVDQEHDMARIQLKDKKLEIARMKEENEMGKLRMEKLKEEKELMMMDVSMLSPVQQEYIRQCQMEILEKRKSYS